MNIILAGYGKMGSLIHTLINEEKRDKVVGVIDPHSDSDAVTAETVCRESLSGGDAVIDFTSPSTVLDNIKVYAEAGIPAVIGTTGWYDHMDEVRELAERNGARLICSANFSIGVAIFLTLAEQSAKLINEFDSYDVSVHEIHHRMKADAPSGTALMIAAGSGVDVRIVTPRYPDKKTVHEVSRSVYRKLVQSGVKVYEFLPGFIHSKTLVSDDRIALVGTANLDYRSFYLHFELSVLFMGGSIIEEVKRDTLYAIDRGEEQAEEKLARVSLVRRLIRTFFGFFAPAL